jgi:hypothetical protein
MRWEEAYRSLWPNSEVHEESLPAMPVLLSTGVQNKNNTMGIQLAIKNGQRHLSGRRRPQTDIHVHRWTTSEDSEYDNRYV